MSPQESLSLPLQDGTTITVVTGDDTRTVAIDRVSEGLVWVSTRAIGALQPGELVDLEIGVRGDARYRTPARVAIAMRDCVGLRLEEEWHRRQAREFVRVNTYGYRVDVAPEDDDDETLRELPLIDLSAGGARVAVEKELDTGDVVEFRLPLGRDAVELVARVVRVTAARAGERRFVSLEFQNVTERMRADLIGWVNQEQLRRRTELRDRSRSQSQSESRKQDRGSGDG